MHDTDDSNPRVRTASDDQHPTELRVEQLRKSFGENHVLRGINLEIGRGEVVAIVGGSGCGKTVLLELMTGQMWPEEGRVLVANHEEAGAPLEDLGTLNEHGLEAIRRHWSIVFQRNALFSGTVDENIALWLIEVKRLDDATIRRRVRDAVEAVGLDPDAVLQKDRDALSGGMAKRVAIARAIAMDPILIFYDEPTTGLDPDLASRIHELIARTHASVSESENGSGEGARTTVIITHDKDLLRRLEPRVVMLHEGKVAFDGPYPEFAQAESEIIRPYIDEMPVLQKLWKSRPSGS